MNPFMNECTSAAAARASRTDAAGPGESWARAAETAVEAAAFEQALKVTSLKDTY